MTTIEIRAGAHRYNAVLGRALVSRFGELLPTELRERRGAIICDQNSLPFSEQIALGLTNSETIVIPAGETSKSLEQLDAICDRMTAAGLDRSSFVVGVGGGVVGDVSGFVAAIFSRGIPHVQVPTTLLAMVDSAIGGKCGVNTRLGKNLLGVIHQPQLVVCDLATLDSLPAVEFRQGMAEVVKHAIIRDAELFELLADGREIDREELIARNIRIKAAIVADDERETEGRRALLNFGHTIGHAVERAGDYELLRHGDAISIGMVGACHVSVKRAGLSGEERDRVVALLDSLGLPTKLPRDISRAAVLDAVRHDKKFFAGEVRFVVTPRVGDAFVSREVTLADIAEAIERL